MKPEEIRIGAAYSNGGFGRHWAVRQVLAIDTSLRGDDTGCCVRYKILVGENRRKVFVCEQDEFARWAMYEVVRNENSWERIGGEELPG